MTLIQIHYFLETVKQGSISKAAQVLHVSQPSISAAIKNLEHELGINLFHRIKMRLSLTREGAYFAEQGQKIIDAADQLVFDMKEIAQKHNQIRIGVPPMIGTFLFPSIFDAFNEKHPQIQMTMSEQGSLMVQQQVKLDQLDVAIAVMDLKKNDGFEVLPITRTQLWFCVSPQHPLADEPDVVLETIGNYPIILFKDDAYQSALLMNCFQQQGVDPHVLLYSSQLYTIKKIIAKGKAGAFLFKELVAMDQDIIGIPLRDPIEMDICLIWKKGRHLYNDTATLIRFVISVFQTTPA